MKISKIHGREILDSRGNPTVEVEVTLENGVIDGGFGEKIARFYGSREMKVLVKGLKKEFYDKVPYGELMERNRLTPKQIAEDVMAVLG